MQPSGPTSLLPILPRPSPHHTPRLAHVCDGSRQKHQRTGVRPARPVLGTRGGTARPHSQPCREWTPASTPAPTPSPSPRPFKSPQRPSPQMVLEAPGCLLPTPPAPRLCSVSWGRRTSALARGESSKFTFSILPSTHTLWRAASPLTPASWGTSGYPDREHVGTC